MAAPGLMQAAPVFAQAAAGANASQAEVADAGEIVVTAQKREQKLSDVGMSIDAIGGDALRTRGITDATDLGKVVVGFQYTNSGEANPVYTIRGVGFFDTSLGVSPAVTVYTDEVPLPYPIMTNLAGLDVQRVEVLKGPQGTVFGQNSTGGAINYIAAHPTDHFEAGLDASYERFNLVKAGGYVSGPLNEKIGVRVSARAASGDGWQKTYPQLINPSRKDTNGKISYIQGRIILDAKPSEALRFSLGVNGWVDKSEPQIGQLFRVTPLRPASASAAQLNLTLAPHTPRAADWTPGLPRRDNTFWQASLRGDLDLAEDVTLTSITAYMQLRRDEATDSDGSTLSATDLTFLGRINSFYQELRVGGKHGPFNWLVGGNYSRDTVFDQVFNHADQSSAHPLIPGVPATEYDHATLRTNQRITSKAVFGNVELEVVEGLTLHGGARYTDNRRHLAGCNIGDRGVSTAYEILSNAFSGGQVYAIRPEIDCVTLDDLPGATAPFAPGLFVDTLKEHNVSWQGGVNYKVTPDSLLYANISKGYKAGSYTNLAATVQSQYAPVGQESVVAYEAGFKTALADRRIQLTGAIFYYDYNDKQLRGKILNPFLGVIDKLVTIPKSRLWGAELQVTAHPVDGLDVSLGGTYLNSKIQTGDADCTTTPSSPSCFYTNNGTLSALQGNPYPFTPKYQFLADTQYKFGLNDRLGMFVGGSVTYNGKTTSDIGSAAEFRIKDYVLLDLRAGLSTPDDRWQLSVFGKNVTNTYYWNNVYRALDTTQRFTGRPATYGVALAYRY